MAADSTNLIIVESPSKARTLKRYLGDNYQIEASVGHIRDLPKSDLGVDIDNNFKPTYVASEDKSKVISQLKKLIKNATTLYLATDPDREGEAIAWHLTEILNPSIPVKRLVFHEITKKAIQESFDHTRDIDKSLVGAQEARRILDRLWGYQVSQKLWYNVKGGLSAGRVQSPSVKIVVDREKERAKFKEGEYWSITAQFDSKGNNFESRLKQIKSQKIAIGKDFGKETGTLTKSDLLALDESRAVELVEAFSKSNWKVSKIEQKPWILKAALFSIPLPWIAIEAGWFVAEFGRQPWAVGEILPVNVAASALTIEQLWTSLFAILALYTVFLIAEVYLMLKFARKGPSSLKTGRYHFEQSDNSVEDKVSRSVEV